MEQLYFTTRVLGKKAADRLTRQRVTQTIRSHNSDIVQAILLHNLQLGYKMDVTLNNNKIGIARFDGISTATLDDLSIGDAWRGGFDSISELAFALKRAGFRFKPIDQYEFYRIRFRWLF